MEKLLVHVAKNFMNLPNIKVPLILGIWGGKGQGKSFQCELVFSKMGIKYTYIFALVSRLLSLSLIISLRYICNLFN
jgi:pantothenate kinase-related protein Tda10